ncbi:DNA topoisomerase IV subunit A [archaeon]|nr:DNA topoisomerase IV subunit A [archaeon]
MSKKRRQERRVLTRLKRIGLQLCRSIEEGSFPELYIPSRSTTNIVYDARLRQYVLGKKKIRRSSRVVTHLRPLTQLLWIAQIAKQLIREGKSSTLRDIYYLSMAEEGVDFKSQRESDKTIADLEALLGAAREDFHIFPEERSAIFGDLTIEYTVPGYEGRQLNLTIHPDGVMIGPALATAEFVDTSAERVIAVEKGAMFTRFVEERVHERFRALIVHTAGQPPRATRLLLRRLNQELGLPVYIFTDADPWGMHIAMVIISGSAQSAHIPGLAVPDAQWCGVWASDIERYELPSERLTARDLKRVDELKRDPRYQRNPWKRELQVFTRKKRKTELEAFSRHGLTFIVDQYLPERLGL